MAYAHQMSTHKASDINHHACHVTTAAKELLAHAAPPFEVGALSGNDSNVWSNNNGADSSGYDGRFDDDGHGGGFGHTPFHHVHHLTYPISTSCRHATNSTTLHNSPILNSALSSFKLVENNIAHVYSVLHARDHCTNELQTGHSKQCPV